MKNKALIGVFAGVLATAAIIAILVAKNAGAPDMAAEATPAPSAAAQAEQTPLPENNVEDVTAAEENTQPTSAPAEEKVYTPTFMYFVSNSDEGYDATMVMLDGLKKEYEGRVNFDIRNIDDDPSLVDNFPVKDNTPTLIMLNTKNDISNILFKTKDKEKLTEAINAALQG